MNREIYGHGAFVLRELRHDRDRHRRVDEGSDDASVRNVVVSHVFVPEVYCEHSVAGLN